MNICTSTQTHMHAYLMGSLIHVCIHKQTHIGVRVPYTQTHTISTHKPKHTLTVYQKFLRQVYFSL